MVLNKNKRKREVIHFLVLKETKRKRFDMSARRRKGIRLNTPL